MLIQGKGRPDGWNTCVVSGTPLCRNTTTQLVCKGNARMYDRSLLTLARGVGRGFMPGLERAIDEAGDV